MRILKSILSFVIVTIFLAARPLAPNYGVGDTVADFKLKNVDGKTVSLADYKTAKGAIVIFDCNTCPYSKAYNQRIIDLNKKYENKGFPVIAINSNDASASPGDSFNEMVRVAKDKGYDFPYLSDESQSVAKSFGATNTPHVFVLTKDGNSFKVAYIGAIDNNPRDASAADKKYVEEAVNMLLSGSPVTNAKTKAIGCGIKWKDA
jgi:peroxiredoxin